MSRNAEAPRPPAPLWRVLGWVLAVGIVVGWVVLLHELGTLPWLFAPPPVWQWSSSSPASGAPGPMAGADT